MGITITSLQKEEKSCKTQPSQEQSLTQTGYISAGTRNT